MSAERPRPLSPKEIGEKKLEAIPDAVIEVFNELMVENNRGGFITIKQKDVVERLVSRGLNVDEIYKKGWLDVEDIYRKAGWKVEYDKPGFNESYDAYFVFQTPSGK